MSPRIGEVIRNPMVKVGAVMEMVPEMVSQNDDIKVIEDEEPGEEKSCVPTRVGYP